MAVCVENPVCFHSFLPCSSYCFSKLWLSIFSPHFPLQLQPAAFPASFRYFPVWSSLCQAVQSFFAGWLNVHWGPGWDHVSHLTCADLSEEGMQAFRAERLPPQPCVLHGSPRLCLALWCVCAEQEDIQHSWYILRGLTVSSCLWRWKQLYLNTVCKLVFQNKRIIKTRERGYQIFMYFKENTINIGVLWLQSVWEQKVPQQFHEHLCAGTSLRARPSNCSGIWGWARERRENKEREGERKKNANGSDILSS